MFNLPLFVKTFFYFEELHQQMVKAVYSLYIFPKIKHIICVNNTTSKLTRESMKLQCKYVPNHIRP